MPAYRSSAAIHRDDQQWQRERSSQQSVTSNLQQQPNGEPQIAIAQNKRPSDHLQGSSSYSGSSAGLSEYGSYPSSSSLAGRLYSSRSSMTKHILSSTENIMLAQAHLEKYRNKNHTSPPCPITDIARSKMGSHKRSDAR